VGRGLEVVSMTKGTPQWMKDVVRDREIDAHIEKIRTRGQKPLKPGTIKKAIAFVEKKFTNPDVAAFYAQPIEDREGLSWKEWNKKYVQPEISRVKIPKNPPRSAHDVG